MLVVAKCSWYCSDTKPNKNNEKMNANNSVQLQF